MHTLLRPDLSIIIVNRNTRELLRACLRSIASLPDVVRCEVIVVDNGSTDGSAEIVTSDHPDVRLIRNETNTGFAFPNNQGLRVARGRHVLLLNSDTEVRPCALERLVRYLDGHPTVGACGPRLLNADGSLQRSCFSFPSPWRHLCDMLDLGRLLPRSRIFANQRDWFEHTTTAPVDWLMGAALVVRREVVERVGILDERFSLYCNELDWCYRIHQAAWEVHFVHDAEVVHHCGATRRNEDRDFRLQSEFLRNHFDYIQKHYGIGGLLWYRLWMVVGFGLRAIRIAVINRVRPTAPGRAHQRLVHGMFRVALTGEPDAFNPVEGRSR